MDIRCVKLVQNQALSCNEFEISIRFVGRNHYRRALNEALMGDKVIVDLVDASSCMHVPSQKKNVLMLATTSWQ